MRTRALAAVVLGASVLIAGCGPAATSPPPATPQGSAAPSASRLPTGTDWLIAGSALSQLEALAGPAAVERYLDAPQTTVITGSTIPAGLSGWHVAFAFDTRSLADIRSGIDGGLPSRITDILYDPEHWSYTPLPEELNVGAATAQAASLARAAGRQLIVTPATDLARLVSPGQPASTAFIKTDDLAKVAASANVVEIQAQGLERNPAQFAAYIAQGAGQVRSGNPSAVIYAGISTNPPGGPVTAAELISAVRLTSSEVSGYWLNIPIPGAACPACGQPQPQIGLELLESLAQ
jgi:hypothetical protein